MAMSVATATLTILLMLSIIFCNSSKVYRICGWLQCISAIFLILTCLSFPLSWNSDEVRRICGPEANKFEFGICDFRWAYPLAIIGCLDGFILSTLAFILASRNVNFQPDTKYKGECYDILLSAINNIYNYLRCCKQRFFNRWCEFGRIEKIFEPTTYSCYGTTSTYNHR